ncbi:MAG: hypothetical protein HQK58_06130 [Deltaproteobacteria bacterium]|nr:hypothetical protein [Deltaproteobacteria bacterium]
MGRESLFKPTDKKKKKASFTQAEKNDLLKQVAESNLPLDKSLTQLNISKSTYYRWLKELSPEAPAAGSEAALDVVSPPDESTVSSEEVESSPAGLTQDQVGRDTVTASSKEKSLDEELVLVRQDAAPSSSQLERISAAMPKSRELSSPKTMIESEEGQKLSDATPKGKLTKVMEKGRNGNGRLTVFILVGIIIIIGGFTFSLCMVNSNKYYIVTEGSQFTLWKGIFAPAGRSPLPDFKPITIEGMDLTELTRAPYPGKFAAMNAIFGLLLEKAEAAIRIKPVPDYVQAKLYLEQAGRVTINEQQELQLNKTFGRLEYTSAMTPITSFESDLHKAYTNALKHLERAKALGFHDGDIDRLISQTQAKAKELNAWLTKYDQSLVAVTATEEARKQQLELEAKAEMRREPAPMMPEIKSADVVKKETAVKVEPTSIEKKETSPEKKTQELAVDKKESRPAEQVATPPKVDAKKDEMTTKPSDKPKDQK